MTSLFDGMAGALNDIFGAPVDYTPVGGLTVVVQAILRLDPIEVTDAEGHAVIIAAPTLRVPRDVVAAPNRGDRVSSIRFPGRVFEVLNDIPTMSPALDGFTLVELEEVDP